MILPKLLDLHARVVFHHRTFCTQTDAERIHHAVAADAVPTFHVTLQGKLRRNFVLFPFSFFLFFWTASSIFSNCCTLNPLNPSEPSLVATWSDTCGRDSSSFRYRRCSLLRAPTKTSSVQPWCTVSAATKYMGAAP